jgi:hypothetical protein
MKRIILSAAFSLLGVSLSFGQYCTGGPSSGADSNIGSVDLNGAGGTAINYVASCPGVTGLDNQTGLSIDLEIGASYTIDIDWGTCGGSYGNAGTAWIDFDGSQTFDVGEEIATWSGPGGTGIISYPFTVPNTAAVGSVRLRVMQQEGGTLPLNPCGSFTWGSKTDFSVNLACPSPSVTDVTICTGTSATLNASVSDGTITWYDDMMTLLTTGPSYTTPALSATTAYNVTTTIAAGTCAGESAPVINTVTVSPVDVTLNVIDETCAGVSSDGTFSVGSVTCGTAPFIFSVDGGAFGPAPGLSAGTYSVVVEDDNGDQSAPISVTINAGASLVPNAPTVTTPVDVCGGVGSVPLDASVTSSLVYTYTINGFDSFGDGWNGASVTLSADGVPVTTFTVSGGSGSGTFSVPEGATLTSTWTSGSFDGECSYNIQDQNGAQIATSSGGSEITPHVAPFSPYTINWYDAPGGTLLGNGSPFEAVGTSVMPAANTGVYEFYATQSNGCESSTELVTVNVTDVGVTLTAVDESCTAYANGSFTLDAVDCGTAPFTYSVDGGAFGAIPTDLTAGTYTILVEDANGLQSAPISLTIGVTSTIQPSMPNVTSPINSCSGVGSIPLDANVVNTVTYTINGFDSFGDGWNGNSVELFADGNSVVNFTIASGASASATFSVPQGATLTSVWSTGSFVGECSYEVLDENGVVIGTSSAGSEITPYAIPGGAVTINWYDAIGGTLVGSGSPFEAVGTSIMPNADPGSYDFYLTQDNGCTSDTALITVNVANVLASITPINETCINYANGTFALDVVDCGTAPFTYSVDGGAFGPIPTDLTSGTYSVVIEDAAGEQSFPVEVIIDANETVIPNSPILSDTAYHACIGDLSVLMSGVGEVIGSDSLETTFAGGNGFAANMFPVAAINTTTIEAFYINLDAGTADIEVYYRPDNYLLTPGANTSAAGWLPVGTATGVVSAGAGNPTFVPVPINITIPAGQTYSFHISVSSGISYTNGTGLGNIFTSDANIEFIEGHGGTLFNCTNQPRVWNGWIVYEAEVPVDVAWFDASAGGNLLGNGSPFEAVGTSVMPDANTEGVYPFYVASDNNGCYSVPTDLVNVYVAPVNVAIDSIDADCNNATSGSFALNNTLCGTAPFTYSVDGGAFGAIPTDLLPGLHTIVVQDANGDVSGLYTIEVGEADAPTNLVMDTITDQGGQVSWIANGTETEWYVEWGLPGFTPGTGSEIGSANATDTFYLITGLNSNENYDVYVAANCGPTQTVGDWTLINFTTECGIYTTPFVETFEDNSETRICWKNEQEVGTTDWTYQTGAGGGLVTTAFEGNLNARFVSQPGNADPITKLVSPRFDFTGQDSVALVFAYAQDDFAGDQNVTKVYVQGQNSTWTEIQSYTLNVDEWTVDTLFLADTTYQFAFEGINNWGYANVVDDVQVLPCNLNPGTDGQVDVCRADSILDLNTVITKGEFFGRWSFPQNETFITNDSIASIGLLPEGTHFFYYIVETPCASDTTVAEVTVFGPSSAGQDGTITACINEPVNLLSGLLGNVDLNGTWFDPQNNALPSGAINAPTIAGNYNYDYVTSNGVCPNDTSNVVLTVDGSCDYLDIQEMYFGAMEVYPNPTSDVVYITNTGAEDVYDYELTDSRGRVIATKENAINGTETTEIDLGKLEPGIYMIKVYNQNIETTYRIVKQ